MIAPAKPTKQPADQYAAFKDREDFDAFFPLFLAAHGLTVEDIPTIPSLKVKLTAEYFEWRGRQK